MFGELDVFIRTLGPWGYPLFGVAALIEYVFPPFPGDTVSVLGGAWAGRGERSYVLLHLALTLGSLVGIAVTWRVGRALAKPIRVAPETGRILGLQVTHIRRAQTAMRERGAMLLVANRFLPSFRSVLFLAAGASDVPLAKALLLGGVSAALFNAMLIAVGAAIGDNVEATTQFFVKFRVGSLVVVAVVTLFFLGRFLWKRARAQSAP
jgi:membrane protein DedA with SNARE-associated domain